MVVVLAAVLVMAVEGAKSILSEQKVSFDETSTGEREDDEPRSAAGGGGGGDKGGVGGEGVQKAGSPPSSSSNEAGVRQASKGAALAST